MSLYHHLVVFSSIRKEKLNGANDEVFRLKDSLERMVKERDQLMAKIEEGEGANTAIQQLKDENVKIPSFAKLN